MPILDDLALTLGIGRPKAGIRKSPPFTFSNKTAIAASGEEVIDFESEAGEHQKYYPFLIMLVQNNNSSQTIEILPNFNGDNKMRVIPRSVQELTGLYIYKIKINNVGTAALSIGDITVTVQNE